MKSNNIVIGSRGSKLALWQTEFVKAELEKLFPHEKFEINIIKTTGDKILDTALSKIGDKGLFTKELENALLANEIDLAVHSSKDLPSQLPEGLAISAFLERENPNDILISKNNLKLTELPKNATIATGSLRRKSQLLHYRSDFNIIDLRGNVDTRIKKFDESNWDGMVLACAGIKRMGYADRIAEIISAEVLLPAVGQGAIGIETRKDDTRTNEIVAQLNHKETELAVIAERSFLRRLEGGCQVPIAAHAHVSNEKVFLDGVIASLNGTLFIRHSHFREQDDGERAGVELAEQMLSQGGEAILAEVRNAEQHP